MFLKSFRRIVDADSEEVVFESDSFIGQQKDSSSSNDGKVTNGVGSKEKEVIEKSNEPLSLSLSGFVRESQFMYIQMEFCEKSTLR